MEDNVAEGDIAGAEFAERNRVDLPGTGWRCAAVVRQRHLGERLAASVANVDGELLVGPRCLERKPELPIQKAVKGMLPKSILGRELLAKLKVYPGPDHPHAAQKPQPLP